jgi:peroxiredoxin
MKTLKGQLEAKNAEFAGILPAEALALMKKAVDDLSLTPILETAAKTDTILPEIILPNIKGEQVSVQDILSNNRVLLVFYRGGWCPYCNLELQALQDLLPKFEEKGIKIIAISPEKPENGVATAESHNLGFEVLTDTDNTIAKQLGLVYKLPNELNELYLELGINVSENQGNNNLELPIAATYLIEQDSKISYHFLEEDYTKRAEPSEILEKL